MLTNCTLTVAVVVCLALWIGIVSPSADLLPGLSSWGNGSVAISLQSEVLGINSNRPTAEQALAAAISLGLKGPKEIAGLFPAHASTPRRRIAASHLRPRIGRTATISPPVASATTPTANPSPTLTPSPNPDRPTNPQPPALVPLDQTIHFTTAPPTDATVDGPSYAVAAVSDSGLRVVLWIDFEASTVCTMSGHTVSFVAAGTCTIDADQVGNADYAAAAQVQQSFSVSRNTQTISFVTSAPSAATVGASYTPIVASDASLPIGLAVDDASASVCALSGGTLSFVGVGTCTLLVAQPGNTAYLPAAARQVFTVAPGGQTLAFTSTTPTNATVGGHVYVPRAQSSSGLPVSLAVDASSSAVCAISSGAVSFIRTGTCTIDANQGGNGNWNPATQVQQSFAVARASQTISFTSTAPANASRERRDLHADGRLGFGSAGQSECRLGERRRLHYLRRHRQLRRCGDLCGQRRPGRRRGLQRRGAGLPELHRREGLPDGRLHLDCAGGQHRRWPLHPDRDGRLGSGGEFDRRCGQQRCLLAHGRCCQLRRCRQLHDRRQPGRKQQLPAGRPGPADLHDQPQHPDGQLQLDRTGGRNGRRQPLPRHRRIRLRPRGRSHRRCGQHCGLLDLGWGCQLPGCRRLHDRREPGRKHHLRAGGAGPADLHRRAGLPDDHLHLDRTRERDRRRRDLPSDGELERGSRDEPQHRRCERECLCPLRRHRQLHRLRHMHHRREPGR